MTASVEQMSLRTADLGAVKVVSSSEPAVTVLMMPDYRQDNPYQALLAKSLETHGCHVEFPKGFRRVFPLYRGLNDCPDARVLHLHWISSYLHGSNRLAIVLCTLKFITDLALVRLSGRRIVWTMHNVVNHEARFPRLEIFATRWLCKLASVVIVHGESGREEAIKQFRCSPEKIHVIPHGNYHDAYAAAPATSIARKQLGLPETKRLVLFLGMIRPYKGLPALLDAWQSISPTEGQLLIAGEASGPYQQQIEQQIANMSGVVWHNRRISADEIPAYLAAADVVALPFTRIQTSGSAMLAMTFGKPVIAPRLGDLPEMLSGADDLMYPAGENGALAERLNQSLRMDLSELGTRSANAALQCDWDSVADRTAAAYRRATQS